MKKKIDDANLDCEDGKVKDILTKIVKKSEKTFSQKKK